MTKDEALKLALEELLIYQLLVDSEWGSCRSNKQIEIDGDTNPVITAIKEALAQPEQEPVATVTSETGNPDVTMSWWHEPALPVGTKLYTAPPKRQPLTDDEIEEIAARTLFPINFARAIEAAHGIKENT